MNKKATPLIEYFSESTVACLVTMAQGNLMAMTVSVDHRVIDCVVAAQFLARVKEMLETEQQKINPDKDSKDRRQKRKQKRKQKRIARSQLNDSGQDTSDQPEASAEEQEKLGALIDMRV